MDYGQIIKRSWEIVKKNKFLWWLGILATFAGGFGKPSFNFSFPQGIGSSSSDTSTTGTQSVDIAKQFSELSSKIDIPAVIAVIAITVVVLLVIYFVILYFAIRAKAGLIIGVNKIENEGNSIGFRAAMREGKKYFWRLFGLMWLIGFIMLALILLIASPLILLIFWHSIAFAIGLGLLVFVGFMVVILLCFLISIILLFAQLMIVLDNRKVFDAIRESWKLIKRNLKEVAIGYAIAIGIGVLVGIITVLLIIVVIAIGSILGGISYLVGGVIALTVCTTVVMLVGIVSFVIVIGFLTAYGSTYWTLFYRALKYIDANQTESVATKESFIATPGV